MPCSRESIAQAHKVRAVTALLAVAGFALLLAACGDASSNTSPARTATPGAQQGIADICSQPVQINASVPSSIPTYPGAQLRISDDSDGHGEFGYCASASPGQIARFYQTQLPTKGWVDVKSVTYGGATQVTAQNGGAQLTATTTAAAANANQASILIIVSGM